MTRLQHPERREPPSTPDRPEVAVVIPTRNRQGTLARAVRSALGQTVRRLEVLAFDDASAPVVRLPDDIAADGRVRVIRSETNVGSAQARNEAVALSSAPYISFLDDDDEWLPSKLERELEALRSAGHEVGLVESGFDLWDGDRLVYRYLPAPSRSLPYALLKEPTIVPSTVTMRRRVYEELGGMDPTLLLCHDWELWLRLIQRYEVTSVPEVHTIRDFHRLHPADVIRYRAKVLLRARPLIRQLGAVERLTLGTYHAAVFLAAGVRLVIGERAWESLERPVQSLSSALARAAGRDPTVKRW